MINTYLSYHHDVQPSLLCDIDKLPGIAFLLKDAILADSLKSERSFLVDSADGMVEEEEDFLYSTHLTFD